MLILLRFAISMACAASNILGGLTTSRHIDPNYAIPCQKYCKNIWRWQLWKHFLSAISSWQDSTFNGPTINVTYTPLLTDWSELTSLLVFTAQLNSMGIQFPNETPFICAYTENCTISKSCVTNILDGLKMQTYRPIFAIHIQSIAKHLIVKFVKNLFCQQSVLGRFNFKWTHH